jgi:hypothetical protein
MLNLTNRRGNGSLRQIEIALLMKQAEEKERGGLDLLGAGDSHPGTD